MQYRREIDGLRTVAVLPVILFHAGLGVFSGGYVGVDVFFVISGFLITTIITNDLEAGRFSILRFYERRARRILPALFTVMVACAPFAWAWMMPVQMRSFGHSLAAVSLFISNILFWYESDYFDTAAEEKPLLHTWSLAVEEQYYLFFPVLLVLLWRFGRNPVFYMVAALAIFSLLASEWASRTMPSANFYLSLFRAWELLAGSLCAFWLRNGQVRNAGNVVPALGLALILAAIFLFDNSTRFPSVLALLPVGGTVMIILFATPQTLIGRILSTAPFVGVGLISYSAYLWHQPLFAFARIAAGPTVPHPMLMLALAGLALILAWLSWRFIELPFRRRKAPALRTRLRVFAASLAGMFAFVAAGAIIHQNNGFPNRFAHAQVGGYVLDNTELRLQSWGPLRRLAGDPDYSITGNPFDRQPWFVQDGREHLLLVGNSHSKDLYNMLTQARTITDRFQIARYGGRVAELLNEDPDLFTTPNYNEADFVLIATRFIADDEARLPDVLNRMAADGKRVAVLLNSPEFSGSVATNLADEHILAAARDGLSEADFPALQQKINRAYWLDQEQNTGLAAQNMRLNAIAQAAGVPVLDRAELFCMPDQRICHAVGPRLEKHFYDSTHTSLEGAAFFARRIDENNWFTPWN